MDEKRNIGELGWILNKRYWKNGYATETVLAIKDFAIKKLKLSKLIAICDARNRSSHRLMERIGLSLESDQKAREYLKSGETAKELTYSLILPSPESMQG